MPKDTWIGTFIKVPIIKKWYGWLHVFLKNLHVIQVNPMDVDVLIENLREDLKVQKLKLKALVKVEHENVMYLGKVIPYKVYASAQVDEITNIIISHSKRLALLEEIQNADFEDVYYEGD
jgi:translation elongation factor EF-1beta